MTVRQDLWQQAGQTHQTTKVHLNLFKRTTGHVYKVDLATRRLSNDLSTRGMTFPLFIFQGTDWVYPGCP